MIVLLTLYYWCWCGPQDHPSLATLKVTAVSMSLVLSGNTSNWRTYLENKYDQFKERKVPVYLATLREMNITQSRSGESHLNIEVGDGTVRNGYHNGALSPGEKYQWEHKAVFLYKCLHCIGSTYLRTELLVQIILKKKIQRKMINLLADSFHPADTLSWCSPVCLCKTTLWTVNSRWSQ